MVSDHGTQYEGNSSSHHGGMIEGGLIRTKWLFHLLHICAISDLFICHLALNLRKLTNVYTATIGLVTFCATPSHTANEIHVFVIGNMTTFLNGDPPKGIQSG